MARTKLARELAEQTGANIRQAATFVDDVGQAQARRLLDTAEDSISWKVPATAGIGTAGALAWRQQDVERAQAAARQAESQQLAARDLIEDSSLSPDQKGRLLNELLAGQGGPGGGGDEANSGDGGFSPLDDLGSAVSDLFGGNGLESAIVQIVILLVIFSIVTNYASEALLPMPDADVNIGGGGQ